MEKFSDFLESQQQFTHKLTTSKGSIYFLANNGTTRTKNSLGRGMGETHPHSSRTRYVTSEQIEKIREMLQNYALDPTFKASIRSVLPDGTLGLVVKNRQTDQRDESQCRLIKSQTQPQVGLCPIEIWDKNAEGEYSYHLGHPIVTMEKI